MKENYKKKYAIVSDLYDTYVNTDYDVDFWISECKKDKEVLELTSGTGRVTIPLAKAGIKVTAIDISKELLDQLKEKSKKEKLKIDIIEADIRTFSLNRKFQLIIIPFQSIQELTDPVDHEACFKQVFKHLDKNGRFIVTTHNFQQIIDLNILKFIAEYPHPKTKNKVLFYMTRTHNPKSQVGTAHQFYEEYDEKGNFLSKIFFRNSYYVFNKEEFEKLIAKCGFKIKNIYGDYFKNKYQDNSPFRIYELTK